MLKQSVKMGRSSISNVVYKTIKFNEKYKIEDKNIPVVSDVSFNKNNLKQQLAQVILIIVLYEFLLIIISFLKILLFILDRILA